MRHLIKKVGLTMAVAVVSGAALAEVPAAVGTAQAAFQADAVTLITGFFAVVAAVAGLVALLRMFKSMLKGAH